MRSKVIIEQKYQVLLQQSRCVHVHMQRSYWEGPEVTVNYKSINILVKTNMSNIIIRVLQCVKSALRNVHCITYILDEGPFKGPYFLCYIVSGSGAPRRHPQSLHVALFTYLCMVLTFCHTCSSLMYITLYHTWPTIHAIYWRAYHVMLLYKKCICHWGPMLKYRGFPENRNAR